MKLGQSIRTGVKWLAFGKAGSRVLEFAFGVALARLLVPADFGMIATIQIFTGFVGMFVAGGMGQSLIRAREAGSEDFTAVFTLQLAIGTLVYAGFFVAAPLAAHFFDDPQYTALVRVSALTFVVRPLVMMRTAWLNREMDFKSRTMIEVATGLFAGVVSVALAALGLGVWSLTLSGVAAALFNNFWLARVAPIQPSINIDVPVMRRHAGYGAKIVATDFLSYLRNQSKILIVSKLAGPSLVGLLNKAESLSRLPNQLLMSPTIEPLFRAMSKCQDDLNQVKYLFFRAVTLLTAYTAPAYVLLWWIANPFIEVVYGSNWAEASKPMAILTVAAFFLNVALPSSTLLAVRNHLRQQMWSTAINLAVTVVLVLIGLRWGLVGVAWAVVATQALMAADFFRLVRHALPGATVRELGGALRPGLILSVLQCAALAVAHLAMQTAGDWSSRHPVWYLLALGLVGCTTYLAALLTLRIPALESEAVRLRQLVHLVFARPVGLKTGLASTNPSDPAATSQGRSMSPILTTIARARLSKLLPVLALLLAVAAGLYSSRYDLEAPMRRWLSDQSSTLQATAPPKDVITYIYDAGVVDADGNGLLDVYTTNHNYQQFIFLNKGQQAHEDVLSQWELDQTGLLPGADQARSAPTIDQPGLYVYWLGDTLRLKFHGVGQIGPAKGWLHIYNLAAVVKNTGVSIEENVTRLGFMPETRIEWRVDKDAELVLYLSTRGAPVRFGVDSPWARTHTRVGRQALVPKHGSGIADPSQLAKNCPTCLEFELALRDRHSMAWADVDGDGRLDVFINRGGLGGTLRALAPEVRSRVVDELMVSTGPGKFEDRIGALGLEKRDCSGRHARWVDVNGDGRLDLFINCLDRGKVAGGFAKQLWVQQPDGRFVEQAAQYALDMPNSQIVDCVWFDADGDGLVDLFTHEDKGYFLYRNRGARFERQFVHKGPFHRSETAGLVGETVDYWQFDGKIAVGDFDSDGDLDVFVSSKRGNVFLVNEGGGRFRSVNPAAAGLPSESVTATWVDLDNDGVLELHAVPQGIYKRVGTDRFQRTGVLALPELRYQAAIANWYDSDNDGAMDLLLMLEDNASLWRWWERPFKSSDVKGDDDRFDWKVKSWRGIGPRGHWLQVNLVGGKGNRQAIGARLTLVSPNGRQARQIGAHEGSYLSQGHYRAYFGLGDQLQGHVLEIRWPDGQQQIVRTLPADQVITIRQEPAAAGDRPG